MQRGRAIGLVAVALAAAAFGIGPVLAHDGAHGTGKLHVVQAWDFTLPTLDGSRFVRASALGGPVLVNFWGRDCAACIAELPRLEAFAKANPGWTVLLVSTDEPAEAREFVQRHGLQLTVLRPGGNVAALMRSAGNRSAGLPFTVAVVDRRVCERQIGELADPDLARMAATCLEGAPP